MEGYNKKVIMSYWTICRMKTTKKIYVKVSIIFLLGGILLFSSCEKEENQKIEANRKTLFMYLPWSSNLTNYFYNNISDLEKCITKIGLNNEKVIVFISTGSTEAMMFEIVSSHGRCKREILKKYKILVLRRDDEDEAIEMKINEYKEKYGAHIKVLNNKRVEISSSMIREMIKEGKSIKYLVTDEVEKFIKDENLYV